MSSTLSGWEILDRMELAVNAVRTRLLRATAALTSVGVRYAVLGDHAVAVWVGAKDPSSVRNSPHIEVAIERGAVYAAKDALAEAGFNRLPTIYKKTIVADDATRPRDSVRLFTPGEQFARVAAAIVPNIDDVFDGPNFAVLGLGPLVRMMLTANRNVDGMHLRDLIAVEWIDSSWVGRLPADLGVRLRSILDDPDG